LYIIIISAVREVFRSSNILADAVIELLDISLKGDDFLFNGEWYIQNTGTSMGRDWAPHCADIYMAKCDEGGSSEMSLTASYLLQVSG